MASERLSFPSGRGRITRPGLGQFASATGSALFAFLSLVVITRMLGVAAFGVYLFVRWQATVAIPLVGVGMSPLAQRTITGIDHEAPRRIAGVFYFVWRKQYRALALYCVVYLLAVFPLSALFGECAPLWPVLIAGLMVPLLLLSGVASVTLRSLRRFDVLASMRLCESSAALLFVLLIFHLPGEQVALLLFAAAMASTLPLVLALVYIARMLPLERAVAPGPFLQETLTRGLSNSLLLFTLDVIIWQPSELFLLAPRHNCVALAFYALSSMVSMQVMRGICALLSSCVLPLLLRYVPGQHYVNATDAFVKTSGLMALLAIPICALIMLLCPLLVTFCFGAAYLPMVVPLRLLLISAAAGCVAMVSLTQLAHGECWRAQVRLGLVGAALNVVLALFGVAFWGVVGAALASAVAQCISATGSILICKRYMYKGLAKGRNKG